MTERQMFGAIVRGVGVYFALYGVDQFWILLVRLLSLFPDAQYRFPMMQDFLYASLQIALGYLLTRRPDWLIHLAFEREMEPERSPD